MASSGRGMRDRVVGSTEIKNLLCFNLKQVLPPSRVSR